MYLLFGENNEILTFMLNLILKVKLNQPQNMRGQGVLHI